MKTAMTALAVLMLATAAPAMAQGRHHDGDNNVQPEGDGGRQNGGGWRSDGGGNRGGGNRGGGGDWDRSSGGDRGGGRWRQEQPAPQTPQAQPAPQARPAPEAPRVRDYSGRRDGGGERRGDGPQQRGDSVGRPGPWVPNTRGFQGDPNRFQGADRSGEQRRGDGDRNRGDGVRDGARGGDQRRWDGDRNRGGDSRGDRNWDGQRDGRNWDNNRRGDNDRRWDTDRRGDSDRRWDGRRDYPRWERGRYPNVYRSTHRYRYSRAWYPPPGFYVRAWSFGDFLPNAWFGPQWWIEDPWAYDLPLPPPGYVWVRSGEDALLVDQWSGRIIQVVRFVFFY